MKHVINTFVMHLETSVNRTQYQEGRTEEIRKKIFLQHSMSYLNADTHHVPPKKGPSLGRQMLYTAS